MKLRAVVRFIAGFAASAMLFAATWAHAAESSPSDPAARQIALFSDTLIGCMKDAKQLGIHGRYDRLKPVIEKTFDLAAMTRAAVGPAWPTLVAADQAALTAGFERMTIANYARNFDNYGGESFTIDPNVQVRGLDRLVQATLVSPHDKPIPFIYRMRQSGGSWKIIDIFLNGYVSELATRRSDFSSTLAAGGSPALIKKVNGLADKLLAGT